VHCTVHTVHAESTGGVGLCTLQKSELNAGEKMKLRVSPSVCMILRVLPSVRTILRALPSSARVLRVLPSVSFVGITVLLSKSSTMIRRGVTGHTPYQVHYTTAQYCVSQVRGKSMTSCFQSTTQNAPYILYSTVQYSTPYCTYALVLVGLLLKSSTVESRESDL